MRGEFLTREIPLQMIGRSPQWGRPWVPASAPNPRISHTLKCTAISCGATTLGCGVAALIGGIGFGACAGGTCAAGFARCTLVEVFGN